MEDLQTIGLPLTGPVNLAQLQAELEAADLAVPSLGVQGDRLVTYSEDGEQVDLPEGAAAVLAAHVPEPPPPPKAELLRSMLETMDPSDPDVEILWLVQMEALTP